MNKKFYILFVLFASIVVQAQKLKKEEKQLVTNLQKHIQFLADDKLEGRRTGTPGETECSFIHFEPVYSIGLVAKRNEWISSSV